MSALPLVVLRPACGDATHTLTHAHPCSPSLRVVAPGSIALASSVNAQLGIGETPYSCAKAALHPLAMNLGVHYGPQGLNANAVAIGTVVRLCPPSAAPPDSTDGKRK